METIILISVLSTLGVVALVTAIVVAFIKLGKKVDVNLFNKTNTEMNLSAEIDREKIYQYVDNIREDTSRSIEDVYRFIDSRCDKLESKIKGLSNNNKSVTKELLND